ncbi:MAG: thioredoxin-dependent thiol peroxidase [Rhodospirillaceae bacterium]
MIHKMGSKAPDFKIKVDDKESVTLKDFKGKNLILYFYPKDDTPGCTKEACSFRDTYPLFKGINAEILGISKDSIGKHEKFRSKYNLPFILASDEEGVACQSYGVWKEKNMYGRKYMGIERSTFLIDEKGMLMAEWRKVKVKGHAEEVLEAAQKL